MEQMGEGQQWEYVSRGPLIRPVSTNPSVRSAPAARTRRCVRPLALRHACLAAAVGAAYHIRIDQTIRLGTMDTGQAQHHTVYRTVVLSCVVLCEGS